MRKSIITERRNGPPSSGEWIELGNLAQVELTSEDLLHPIESALKPGPGAGWRAAEPGKQVIRLHFDNPLTIRKIRLLFQEDELARTQEFVLRWSGDRGATYREIVRQQYNFSPPGTNSEEEEYQVNLPQVTNLELAITPELNGGRACASLAQLLIG